MQDKKKFVNKIYKIRKIWPSKIKIYISIIRIWIKNTNKLSPIIASDSSVGCGPFLWNCLFFIIDFRQSLHVNKIERVKREKHVLAFPKEKSILSSLSSDSLNFFFFFFWLKDFFFWEESFDWKIQLQRQHYSC